MGSEQQGEDTDGTGEAGRALHGLSMGFGHRGAMEAPEICSGKRNAKAIG